MLSKSIVHFAAGLFVLLGMQLPLFSQWDVIDDKLDNWVSHAEGLGYEVVHSEASRITSILTLNYTLEPGAYHVFAEGGEHIVDLGLFVYGETGEEIASHPIGRDSDAAAFTESDDGLEIEDRSRVFEPPSIEFTLGDRELVTFELEVFRYEFDYDEGFICFVLAKENGDSAGTRQTVRYASKPGTGILYSRRRYSRFRERYWKTWFEDESGYLNAWKEYLEEQKSEPGASAYSPAGEDRVEEYDRGHTVDLGPEGDSGDYTERQRWDYVEAILDDLYEKVYAEGLIPIVEHIAEIDGFDAISITLPAGHYVLYAGNGPRIEELRFSVRDDYGYQFRNSEVYNFIDGTAWDVWFQSNVEIEAEELNVADILKPGYYCILLCMKYGG